VHVDDTARPQFVNRKINPSMHAILSYFYEMTGHPILVNTSFNMHEEPIVCTPEDAVRAYLSSRLDYLACGPFLCWIEGAERGTGGEAHTAEELLSG
jgi:carbamoyltransferase